MRSLVEDGQISYPYSTRELVNIVRHLQNYPKEGLSRIVQNVFDFDQYDKEIKGAKRGKVVTYWLFTLELVYIDVIVYVVWADYSVCIETQYVMNVHFVSRETHCVYVLTVHFCHVIHIVCLCIFFFCACFLSFPIIPTKVIC